jgi:hypothetical protein
MLKKLILTFFIAIVMNACHKKDNDPVVFAPHVCYMTSSGTFGENYFATYDHNNNMIVWQGIPFTYRIQYDWNNRVTRVLDDSLGKGFVPHYTSYYYDLAGHLKSDTIFKITGNEIMPPYTYKADSINTFTYSGENITRQDHIKIGGRHLYSEYAYNTAGDIIQQVDHDNSGAVVDTTIFVYDNKKSNKKPLFFRDPVLASQKHNIVYAYTSFNNIGNDAKSYFVRYKYTPNGYVFTENVYYYNATENPVKYYFYNCK